jgi:hypothetical protein
MRKHTCTLQQKVAPCSIGSLEVCTAMLQLSPQDDLHCNQPRRLLWNARAAPSILSSTVMREWQPESTVAELASMSPVIFEQRLRQPSQKR